MQILNRLEKSLSRRHEVPLKTIFFQLPCPQLVEIAGRSGIDFAIIDLEHSQISLETLEYIIALGQGIPMSVLVRVDSVNSHKTVHKALELGARGIIFPMISNRDEAELAVRSTRFPPLGNRGAALTTRDTHYSGADWNEYCAQANKEVIVGVMIENQEGVENIDSIVSVDGIDVVIIGPGDMSLSYNVKLPSPADMDPVLEEAANKVIKASVDAGVSVAFWGDLRDIQKWIRRGVHICYYGTTDAALFYSICKQVVDKSP